MSRTIAVLADPNFSESHSALRGDVQDAARVLGQRLMSC